MSKLTDLNKFNLWDDDTFSKREKVIPLKKHKFKKENIYYRKKYIPIKENVEGGQEYWTQKRGFHWRTCRRCGEYVKGKCWKCGSIPCTDYMHDGSIQNNVGTEYVPVSRDISSHRLGFNIKSNKSGSTFSQLKSLGSRISKGVGTRFEKSRVGKQFRSEQKEWKEYKKLGW